MIFAAICINESIQKQNQRENNNVFPSESKYYQGHLELQRIFFNWFKRWFVHFWKTFKFAASLFHPSHQSPLGSAEVLTWGTHSGRLRLSCTKNHGLLLDKMGERCIAAQSGNTNKWNKNINMNRIFFFRKASPRKAKEVDLIYFFSENLKENPYAQTASQNRTLSHQLI